MALPVGVLGAISRKLERLIYGELRLLLMSCALADPASPQSFEVGCEIRESFEMRMIEHM